MNKPATTHNRTADWQAIDARHHLQPFTNYTELHAQGVRVMTRAEGVYIWDSEGNRLLDGMAGLWCVNVGYGRRELEQAAAEQIKTLPYYNTFFQTTHPPAVELSEILAEVTPKGLNHVFFVNSGSEANDTVLRAVRRYWEVKQRPGKSIIISRHNAYHGSTMAAASLGGMKAMHEQGGLPIPGVEHIRQPYWYGEGESMTREAFGLVAAAALEERIEQLGADNVAAFIGEPIQGAGGVIVPPASYWPEIERICRAHDVLLVSDEVICGFGRTGRWFGCETLGFTPDVMAMAKGLSSGYLPIGGVMLSDEVAGTLIESDSEFQHGFTYSGHPVCCAVALANVRLMRDEGLVTRVGDDIGPYFQERLRELEALPIVGEVRGHGLIAGIQLAKDKATRTRFDNRSEVSGKVKAYAMENGLMMRATDDSMVLSPPLTISREEVDELVGAAADALARVGVELGLVCR